MLLYRGHKVVVDLARLFGKMQGIKMLRTFQCKHKKGPLSGHVVTEEGITAMLQKCRSVGHGLQVNYKRACMKLV